MLKCTESGEDITAVIKKRKISWLKKSKLRAELASDEIKVDVLKEVIEEVDAVEHKETNLQELLDRILQYTPLQVVLLVLAIIDVAVVVSEILVTLHVYDIERTVAEESLASLMDHLTYLLKMNQTNDVEKVKVKLNETFHSFVNLNKSTTQEENTDGRMHSRYRSIRSISDGSSTTSQYNSTINKLHLVENILDIITITILGFFVLMALLHIIAEGKKFFNKKTEIIDSAVSIISFILYATKISRVLRKDAAEAVIVLLLLWQIVHMFNGIVMSEMKRLDFRITLLKRTKNKLEAKLLKKKKKNLELKEEIKLNKVCCKRKGFEWEVSDKSQKAKPSLANGIARLASLTLGVTLTTSLNLEMDRQKQERKRKINYFNQINGDDSCTAHIGQFPNGVIENWRGQNGIDLSWMTLRKKDLDLNGDYLGKINESYESGDDDDNGEIIIDKDVKTIGYNRYVDINKSDDNSNNDDDNNNNDDDDSNDGVGSSEADSGDNDIITTIQPQQRVELK